MDIQRLKFAYARGAQIQICNGGKEWLDCHTPGFFPNGVYRIHPDDVDLEYGPLSTALRKRVLEPGYFEKHWQMPDLAAVNQHMHFAIGKDYDGHADDNYNMALLFYAEMLADEGL